MPSLQTDLIRLLGDENVIRDARQREELSRTTLLFRSIPDLIVYPQTSLQVQEIMKLAQSYQMPVWVVSQGSSHLHGFAEVPTHAHGSQTIRQHLEQLDEMFEIVAIGRAKFVTADMVKPGAVVIDVGINRTAAGLVGDVDFDAVAEVASAITPVPGGVGPLTIAMLLRNTLSAAQSLET